MTTKEISGGMAPRPAGHGTSISSLDSLGNLLLTADQKDTVLAWDVRSMGSTAPLLKYSVLGVHKIMLVSSRVAVATTSQGLVLLHLESGQVTPVPKFSDGRPTDVYNDMRWNRDKSILFAAGGDGKLDLYSLS